MTLTELTHQIRDIIRTITHKEPVMPIHVRKIYPVGYEVAIEFQQNHPTFYSAELPDDLFLPFIYNELKRNKSLQVEYRKVERNTKGRIPNDFVSPYDTRRINAKDGRVH